MLPKAEDLPGRYLRRGDVVGHVDTGEPPVVRVVVPHWQAMVAAAPLPGAAPAAGGPVQVRLPQT